MSLRRFAPFSGVLLGAAVFFLAVVAPAQSASAVDVAKAEGLFNQGVKLLEQKKYAEACTMLEESRKLAPGLGVTLYLADCFENVGRSGAAHDLFREAERIARERNDPRKDVAKQRAERLEQTGARLLLKQSSEATAAGQTVMIDGRKVEAVELGQPIVIDPGAHKIRATAKDGSTWDATTTTAQGAIVTLEIPLAKAGVVTPTAPPALSPSATPTPAPEPTPAPTPDTAVQPSDPGSSQRTIGLVVGGVGLVAVGVGVVFGLQASSKQSDSNADNHCDANNKCDAVGLDLRDKAITSATLSTVFVVVGGVMTAGGASLFLLAPKRSSSAAMWLTPAVGGAALGGRF